jgi:predicted phosphodiesterase
MKFLHTADWQIGMKADFVGAAAQAVRSERLAAGKRVVSAAQSQGAEFIVVAGDLFENNAVSRTLVQQTADILARFAGPVYIIPGNHDPLEPGSVWQHPVWNSFDNLHVLQDAEPLEIPGGRLYPCPVRDKYSRKDPTAWIPAESNDTIRIALAHGNVEGLPQPEPDHPIARDAAARCRLDYLALGHWHSYAAYPDPGDTVRMAYSGTHETSRFGERDSGHALVVEIQAPGTAPSIEPIQTGRLHWRILEAEIAAAGDLANLRRQVEAIEAPDTVLLDVRLTGLLFAEEKHELFHLEDLIAGRFLYARLDAAALVPSPEDAAWIEALPSGILQEAARRLQQQAAAGGEHSETAARALLELYAAVEEGAL